jgi:hypothetical protein
MDPKKSDFSLQFKGKNPGTFKLAVTKDGGQVDAITAATISSRAFCDAVDLAYRAFIQVAQKEVINEQISIITKGILKENPIFVLVLGMCPTLGTTTSAFNGLGMGLATTFVLMLSNLVISLIAGLIPAKVRIRLLLLS